MDENNLHDPFQSVYKVGHSTETALMRVHNDVAMALDRREIAVLVLLDLSAAFDTLDHAILIERMSTLLGVDAVALE